MTAKEYESYIDRKFSSCFYKEVLNGGFKANGLNLGTSRLDGQVPISIYLSNTPLYLFKIKEDEFLFAPIMNTNWNTLIFNTSGDIADKLLEIDNKKSDFVTKIKKNAQDAFNLIRSFSTENALANKWPEIKPYYDFENQSTGTVIAIPIDEFNKKLGLPIKENE